MKNNVQDKRFAVDYHNTAPTLPLHSPHSPLNLNSQHQQNKLSPRYIENKIFSDGKTFGSGSNKSNQINSEEISANVLSTNILASSSQNVIPADSLQNQKEESLMTTKNSSKDNCIKQSPKKCASTELFQQAKKESSSCGHMFRSTTTRNAATSPVLDVRKLSQFSTVSPRNFTKNVNRQPDAANTLTLSFTLSEAKSPVEKCPSLDLSKPQKQLRSTRSLSPRPLPKQSQALMISDEKEMISLEVSSTQRITSALSPLEIRNEKYNNIEQKSRISCKSEQSSPNFIDVKDIKFNYSKITNRSTDCLSINNDPWQKMGHLNNENNFSIDLHSKNQATKVEVRNDISVNYLTEDPWIKRIDPKISKQSKKDFLYQGKSLSVAGVVDSSSNNKKHFNRHILQRCKSPAVLDNNIPLILPMLSAPASPLVLQTPRNPFCSALSLTYQHNTEQFSAQTRSTSFSPARVKDFTNPFLKSESSSILVGSPPKSITSTFRRQKVNADHSLLEVGEHFPEGRHSISSASTSNDKDELPLNIRRLSDQIFRTTNVSDNPEIESFKNRSSFGKNVQSKSTHKMEVHKGADFSDYLNQFRNSEARKAAAMNPNLNIEKLNDSGFNANKIHSPNKDSPLETTC